MSSSPWLILGIEQTSDKDAIRAAYDAERAKLDISMNISAFARLTEAREKALFLASEMQREATAAPVVENPPIPADEGLTQTAEQTPAEPEYGASIAALNAPRITLIRLIAARAQQRQSPPDQNRLVVGRAQDRAPRPVPVSYVDPAVDEPMRQGEYYPSDAYEHQPGAAFLQRYRLDKFGVWWLGGILFLLAFCSDIDSGDNKDGRIPPPAPPPPPVRIERPDAPDPQAMDPLIAELFGPDITYADVASSSSVLAQRMAYEESVSGANSAVGARSYLRMAMLEARFRADRETLIALNQQYLDWLKAADEMGGSNCREVTDHSFYDDVPAMSENALLEERDLARRLLLDRAFDGPVEDRSPGDVPIPQWAMASIQSDLGISDADVTVALSNRADPDRCKVTISLLEALLARPDEAPRDLLVSL